MMAWPSEGPNLFARDTYIFVEALKPKSGQKMQFFITQLT